MTIPEPFTQREIETRIRLGFGPVPLKPVRSRCYDLFVANFELLNEAAPKAINHIHQVSSTWDFDEAVEILARRRGCRLTGKKDRHNCRAQIAFICRLGELERLAETQETSGSKASAFQKERRWYKRRQRATSLPSPRLPQALEQEAARLQAAGALPDESFVVLRDRYKSASGPGRGASRALVHTVRRLQALASYYAPDLTWTRRDIPPELITFLVATLDAVEINHPDFGVNPSKFRRLMLKPPRKQQGSRNRSAPRPPETELERQLLKTPL
jgi:hypothetical protein